MPRREIESALGRIPGSRVAVFGDHALDAYWTLDPRHQENSIETGLPIRRVIDQTYSAGGASNVASCAAALGLAGVYAMGFVGDDMYGRTLVDILRLAAVDVGGLIRDPDWQTPVYAKPMLDGVEQSRLDFGADNTVDEARASMLLAGLDATAACCDAVIVNQQLAGGVATPAVLHRVRNVVTERTDCVFVFDARERGQSLPGAVLKVNAEEACKMADTENVEAAAAKLAAGSSAPVFVTLGVDGSLVADGATVERVPGCAVEGPSDAVGAGDAYVAAIAAALGAGVQPTQAARLANAAAAVTVQKLQTTGTASPHEILSLVAG